MKDTNQDKATPRPWITNGGVIFGDCGGKMEPIATGWRSEMLSEEVEANASLIVRAVNEYDALNAVAEAALEINHDPKLPHFEKLNRAISALAAVRKQNGGAS